MRMMAPTGDGPPRASAWLVALGLAAAALVPRTSSAAVLTTIDSVGNVGRDPSVVYGRDGLPIVAYYDETQTALKVAHCEDPGCTTATITTLDTTENVGVGAAIVIGQDGLPLIAYRQFGNAHVRTAHCADVACTSATLATVDVAFTVIVIGRTGMTLGNDGLPIMAYGAPFKVAHCLDVPCTSVTATPYSSSPGGLDSSIVIGSDGFPLMATGPFTGAYTAHCEDLACTAASFTPIPEDAPGADVLTYEPFIAKGTGAPVVVYTRFVLPSLANHFTLLRRCADTACQTFTSPVVLEGGDGQWVYPIVAIRPGDLPLAVTHLKGQGVPSRLVAKWCQDPACSSVTTEDIESVEQVQRSSLALGPSGEAFVAYYDPVSQDLKGALLTGSTQGDLALAMTVAPDHGLPGDTVAVHLTVTNLGASAVASAVVTDPLPAAVEFVSSSPQCTYHGGTHVVTCAVPGLAPGGSATMDLTVRLRQVPAGAYPNTATVAGPVTDPIPSNNTATATLTVDRWLSVDSPFVLEGDAGLATLAFAVTLNDAVPPGPPATVDYATSAGTATAGADFQPVSGTLTFGAGSLVRTVTVGVVGDVLPERAETFFLGLANAQGAGIVVSPGTATIVDDDAAGLAGAELAHGATVEADLAGGPDLYALAQSARASYEVVVDAAAGDVVPLALERLAPDGSTVVQSGTPVGTGTGLSLRWALTGTLPVVTERIRVAGACGGSCDAGDRYRARAYETTGQLPRFNNAGTQTTVLLLHNPSDHTVAGTAWFWNASGTLVESLPMSIPARALHVVNTAAMPLLSGVAGTITLTHDAPYGVLQGKAVALEPATGFSFDTPLVYRPR